jgi:hypothetical protein
LCTKQASDNFNGVVTGIIANDTAQDFNYVENIVHGHLLLEAKLDSNPELVSGQVIISKTWE